MSAKIEGSSAYRSALDLWRPLIGELYGKQLARAAVQLLYAAGLFVIGLVLMIAIGVGYADSPVVILGYLCGFLGLVCYVIPLVKKNQIGVELAKSLGHAGIFVNRRAPLNNPHLYKKWLAKNAITAQQVVHVLDGGPSAGSAADK